MKKIKNIFFRVDSLFPDLSIRDEEAIQHWINKNGKESLLLFSSQEPPEKFKQKITALSLKIETGDTLISKMDQYSLIYGTLLSDIPFFQKSGFSTVSSDAPDSLKNHAHHILNQKDGEGCLAELIDKALNKSSKSQRKKSLLKSLFWTYLLLLHILLLFFISNSILPPMHCVVFEHSDDAKLFLSEAQTVLAESYQRSPDLTTLQNSLQCLETTGIQRAKFHSRRKRTPDHDQDIPKEWKKTLLLLQTRILPSLRKQIQTKK